MPGGGIGLEQARVGDEQGWDSASRTGKGQRPWKAAGEGAFFAGSRNVIISTQFPGQKSLVYLNTSASQSRGSPDTIKFAFSPWCFHFPFAAGGAGYCVLPSKAFTGCCARLFCSGDWGKTGPIGEVLVPCVPQQVLAEMLLLHGTTSEMLLLERFRSIRFE